MKVIEKNENKNLILNYNEKEETTEFLNTKEDKKENKVTYNKLNRLILGVSLVLLLFLLKNFIISYTDTKIFCIEYKERIDEIISKKKLISLMIKDLENKDLDEIINKKFDEIKKSNNKDEIQEKDFIDFYGSDGSLIFDLLTILDDDDIEKMTKNEFINGIYVFFSDKNKLIESIKFKNKILKKLNLFVTLLSVPFSLFFFLCAVGGTERTSSFLTTLSGFLLGMSYLFSPILSKIIESFISILFTKPYEINDVILFKNEEYLVKEPGLLYTILTKNSINFIIPSSHLSKDAITNLKNSDFYDKIYNFDFDYEIYKDKKELFEDKVKFFIDSNSKQFSSDFEIIENYYQKNKIDISIKISIKFISYFLEYVNKRSDFFLLEIYKIIKEIGLK